MGTEWISSYALERINSSAVLTSSCEYSLAIKCPRKPWGAGHGANNVPFRFVGNQATKHSWVYGARLRQYPVNLTEPKATARSVHRL